MVGLAGIDRVASAVAAAHDVAFSAYVLRPGKILDALEASARGGGHVAVTLQGSPYDDDGSLASENARIARELRDAGATVRLVGPDEPPVHLKAAIADGVTFLDDRNWAEGSSSSTIVRSDEPDDARIVRAALDGRPASDAHLDTRKAEALLGEAALIAQAPGDRIDCESESFSYSPVLRALGERARHGAHVRLMVNARDLAQSKNNRERIALDYLVRVGVDVRLSDSDEKLCVAGSQAWVGSANASGGAPDTIDWGLRADAPQLVDTLASHFTANWDRSSAYAAGVRTG